jgi:hypothetical protein
MSNTYFLHAVRVFEIIKIDSYADKIGRHAVYVTFHTEIRGSQARGVNFVECVASHVLFVRLMVLT